MKIYIELSDKKTVDYFLRFFKLYGNL